MSDWNDPNCYCVPVDDDDYPTLRLPPRETQSLHLVTEEDNERLRRRAAAWKAVAKRWREEALVARAERAFALSNANEYERRAEMRMETLQMLFTTRQLDEEERALMCDACFMRRREEVSE